MIMKLIGIWMIIHEDKNKNIDDEDDEDNNSADEQLPSLGASTPLRQCCISPCFRFPPYFRKKFQTSWKIFRMIPFPTKFLDFHP